MGIFLETPIFDQLCAERGVIPDPDLGPILQATQVLKPPRRVRRKPKEEVTTDAG